MAEVEVKTDDTGVHMTLKGNLDIERASDLHKVIVEAIRSNDVLHIDMGQVNRVDLSFFQLVCALYKEAVGEGKRLIFDPVPQKIRIKAEKMGFTEEYTGGYFWKGEGDV